MYTLSIIYIFLSKGSFTMSRGTAQLGKLPPP